jgi:hypothetical protein
VDCGDGCAVPLFWHQPPRQGAFLTRGYETSKDAAVDAVAQTLREKLDL